MSTSEDSVSIRELSDEAVERLIFDPVLLALWKDDADIRVSWTADPDITAHLSAVFDDAAIISAALKADTEFNVLAMYPTATAGKGVWKCEVDVLVTERRRTTQGKDQEESQ